MAIDVVGLALVAKTLIEDNGRPLTYTPAPASDPAEPWKVGATDPAVEFIGVVSRFDRRFVDGTTIRASDKRILAPETQVAGLQYKPGGKIVDGSETLNVIDVTEIQPGADRALFIIQARA